MPVTIDGSNTPTAGGVGYGDGTELAFTSAGSAGQVLLSNGASAPSFGALPTVNLATGVTGTLPVGNGGTGVTSSTGSGSVVLNTNPAITNPTVTNYVETPVTANTGTTYTIDITNGTFQILTLTDNCTFTFPTATSGKSFILLLKQDGTGGRTATWPAAVKWPGGTAPTITSTANRLDKFIFSADGTNWYGSNAGQNYTV
jgi:hypothetical protein